MARVMNFNPGPATLPLSALEEAQKSLLDIDGSGMSVMEHSHRGKTYAAVHDEAIALVTELLGVPDTHTVLLLQGGASQQFAMVPMNFLSAGKSADYVVTGSWSKKAAKEAKTVGQVKIAWDVPDGKYVDIPGQADLSLDPDAAYVHITSNNTIAGSQWHQFPDTGSVRLVADMSSDIMWRPIDVSKFGLIYAGAQKNIGPSGITLVIADKEWIAGGREDIPTIFKYQTHAEANSLYNTPPTFPIYMLRNVMKVVKAAGGLSAMEKQNRTKAELLYEAIDGSDGFYRCPVKPGARSVMNVVFNLETAEKEADFIAKAAEKGLVGLKGHRSVGGVRASIYNAAPLAWVEALVSFMKEYK